MCIYLRINPALSLLHIGMSCCVQQEIWFILFHHYVCNTKYSFIWFFMLVDTFWAHQEQSWQICESSPALGFSNIRHVTLGMKKKKSWMALHSIETNFGLHKFPHKDRKTSLVSTFRFVFVFFFQHKTCFNRLGSQWTVFLSSSLTWSGVTQEQVMTRFKITYNTLLSLKVEIARHWPGGLCAGFLCSNTRWGVAPLDHTGAGSCRGTGEPGCPAGNSCVLCRPDIRSAEVGHWNGKTQYSNKF